MFERLERLILLQIGAAAVTRERVQEAVNRLIEQGRIERAQGGTMVEDVLTRARERSTGARSLIDASVQQGLRGAGVPTRESYEDLLFRVEQLEHRLTLLEAGTPAEEPPVVPEDEPIVEEEITIEPEAEPEPPVGDIDAPPPRDEPATPPGAPPPGPQPGL